MKTILSTELSEMAGIEHKQILKTIDRNKHLFKDRVFGLPGNKKVGRPRRVYKLDSACVGMLIILIENDIDKSCVFEALDKCDIINSVGISYSDNLVS
jgi:hypothetical protein